MRWDWIKLNYVLKGIMKLPHRLILWVVLIFFVNLKLAKLD
ncbi:hypothetical protein PEDI_40640 [Persicobacter diffluens]|uniref:Uncharacterized protein n=1 Tax=Persicobacter diffluens TaxID=981 RepID=A0AAN4W3C9_9BACT|nr:hypothetical protein PEDI_40640 [Persicobacter diffluens]